MRTIKFRAWDKAEKKMKEVSGLDLVKDGVVWVELIGDTCFEHLMWNYVELMQFTGLQDKNGVEIYEGDIIEGFTPEYLGSEKYVGSVFWYEYKWVHGFLEGRPPKAMWEDIKVIGNIYENPELLED